MKTGRNDACPCGSGKKYKKCCGLTDQEAVAPLAPAELNRLAVLLRSNRHADLEARARELLEQYPKSGMVTKVLALALSSQGKPALPYFVRAAELLPDDAEAHGNLGNAYRALGQIDEAIRAHRRALEIDPQYAKSHNDLGSALQDCGCFEEAAASFRRAVALKADFALAYFNLSNLLALENQLDEAEVNCRRALLHDPRLTVSIVQLAELQASRGDFAAAENLLKHAISIESDMPEAWAGLARFRKMTDSDAAWLSEARRIAGTPLPSRREIPLRFALGKYFDDVGDYAEAFANYRRANELSRAIGPAYDAIKHRRAIDGILVSYDMKWLTCARLDSHLSPRPVLIVGMPRSGTTLVEQILASHSRVHGAGEIPFWFTAVPRYETARVTGRGGRDSLESLASAYTAELSRWAPQATWVVDKMPANFLYLGLIHAALPDARIIHLKRNPLDTCLSVYFQQFGPGHAYANDLDDLGHYYKEYLRVMDHWRRTLPPGVMLEVAYEDLVGDPERWSREMLKFIELPWDPACLEFHRSKRPVATLSKWQARQKIAQTSVARWRRYEHFLGPLRECLAALPR